MDLCHLPIRYARVVSGRYIRVNSTLGVVVKHGIAERTGDTYVASNALVYTGSCAGCIMITNAHEGGKLDG